MREPLRFLFGSDPNLARQLAPQVGNAAGKKGGEASAVAIRIVAVRLRRRLEGGWPEWRAEGRPVAELMPVG